MSDHRKPDRILLTGIGGAVGGEVAQALASRPRPTELIGVFSTERSRDGFCDRASAAVLAALRPEVCDLTDPRATAELAVRLDAIRPTVVVHAAANVSWTASPEQARRGNVDVTRNTAELARALGRPRFILVSSAYTAVADWEYRNTYEESKAAAERMLHAQYADLEPVVFSCSLVVGHSVTGAISRFHGIYPLLGLIDRHQPPFLPADRAGRIDIVPLDWVAHELTVMIEDVLAGRPVQDVVAAAGDAAPLMVDLVVAVVAALNRARTDRGEPPVPAVPLVPFRRWDFLRRSIEAWQVEVPNQQDLYRLIAIYRPYLENARVRMPQGLSTEPPPWLGYVDVVVDQWVTQKGRRLLPTASPS